MYHSPGEHEISEDDLRTARKELKGYVDITEADLKEIYAIALRHAKERLALKIPVSVVMTTEVVTVKKEVAIHEAARILSENKISGMPVIDEENHVIGVVTERDILCTVGMRKHHTFRDLLRHILGEPLPRRKNGDVVGDIMTSPAITVKSNADIKEVARMLDERRIKRMAVVDNENKLIGIISRADIVRLVGKQ